jgi:hypothetical protein
MHPYLFACFNRDSQRHTLSHLHEDRDNDDESNGNQERFKHHFPDF